MRKIFLTLILLLITFIPGSVNVNPINENKIKYTINGIESQTLSTDVLEEIKLCTTIIISVDLDYELLDTSYLLPPEGCTQEEAKALKDRRRELGKEYYLRMNNEYARRIDGKNYQNRYISTYFPKIDFEYDKDEFIKNKNAILSSLSVDDSIKEVEVIGNFRSESLLGTALEMSSADMIVTDRQYTGSGLQIGVLDEGIVIEDAGALAGVNLNIRDLLLFFEKDSLHATQMASIIANQDLGIVPDAQILSVQAYGSLTGELDWLVDNGADIINMSIGTNDTKGQYEDTSAECDFICKQYGVVMVAAAGNQKDGDHRVVNPGMGYNVLAVGNHGLFNELNPSSSFVESSGAQKPNLCVCGTGLCIPGYITSSVTGTSCSSAVMTGMIGALMSQYSDLIGNPGKVMSLVMACCDPVTGTTGATRGNGFNDKWGTGLFNYSDAKISKSSVQVISVNTSTGAGQTTLVTTQSCGFTIGKPIRVSMFWLANANGESSETTYTKYTMELYDSANKLIATATSGSSNYMYIYKESAVTAGRYRLKIYQEGPKAVNGTENLYLAFGYDS